MLEAIFAGRLDLVVSEDIWNEYVSVPARPRVTKLFLRRDVSREHYLRLLDTMRPLTVFVNPAGDPPPCRDEDDRKYLHAALAGAVQALLTADKDLLDLKRIGGAVIQHPAAFLVVTRRSL